MVFSAHQLTKKPRVLDGQTEDAVCPSVWLFEYLFVNVFTSWDLAHFWLESLWKHLFFTQDTSLPQRAVGTDSQTLHALTKSIVMISLGCWVVLLWRLALWLCIGERMSMKLPSWVLGQKVLFLNLVVHLVWKRKSQTMRKWVIDQTWDVLNRRSFSCEAFGSYCWWWFSCIIVYSILL